VTLAAEVSAQDVADHTELSLFIITTTEEPRPNEAVHAAAPGHQRVHVWRERQDSSETITGNSDWTSYEITAQVPAYAETIGFELTLAGPGIVRLRHLELAHTS
jgi:hypothetical protein